jgi:hypothetical protein
LVQESTGEKKPAIIYEDNLGTIFLVKNQQVSSKAKHIDIRHPFMRDLQEKKDLDVRFKQSAIREYFSRHYDKEHNKRRS